jgi:transcriptional regulator GlxA family with amidase domain
VEQQDESKREISADPGATRKLQIGIFVCPGYFPADRIGLHAAFGILPNTEVHLVWKNKEPITGFPTFPTRATSTFSECPRDLDVLNIGAVPSEILEDDESIAFIADRGSRARWVTSVCAGSLVLGPPGCSGATAPRRTSTSSISWSNSDLRVEALAARAGMSPRTFARVFAAEVGATPAKFVETCRLEQARAHLEMGSATMNEIGHASGFGSEERVRRAFQRVLRVTPEDYARRFSRRAGR